MKQAVVWTDRTNRRAVVVCDAAVRGLRRCGYQVMQQPSDYYHGARLGDVAVFYGLRGKLQQILRDYSSSPASRAVYIDLGYWHRKQPGAGYNGYHKVVVNATHPTVDPAQRYDAQRFAQLGVPVVPPRSAPATVGDYVVLAGMSGKAAGVYGYQFEEWERWAVQQCRAQLPHLPIVYRPKPTVAAQATRALAHRFSVGEEGYEVLLRHAYAILTHHSNVAVDGIAQGTPCFVIEGAARALSGSWESLGTRRTFSAEEQWNFLCGLAWYQWTLEEMVRGEPWAYLRARGELP